MYPETGGCLLAVSGWSSGYIFITNILTRFADDTFLEGRMN